MSDTPTSEDILAGNYGPPVTRPLTEFVRFCMAATELGMTRAWTKGVDELRIVRKHGFRDLDGYHQVALSKDRRASEFVHWWLDYFNDPTVSTRYKKYLKTIASHLLKEARLQGQPWIWHHPSAVSIHRLIPRFPGDAEVVLYGKRRAKAPPKPNASSTDLDGWSIDPLRGMIWLASLAEGRGMVPEVLRAYLVKITHEAATAPAPNLSHGAVATTSKRRKRGRSLSDSALTVEEALRTLAVENPEQFEATTGESLQSDHRVTRGVARGVLSRVRRELALNGRK